MIGASVALSAPGILAQLSLFTNELTPNLHLRSVTIEATPHDGETLAQAIIRIRGEIVAAQAELVRLKLQPLPRDELQQRAKDYVEQLAAEAGPLVRTANGSFEVEWAVPTPLSYGVQSPSRSAAAMLCAMFPDKMLDLIVAQLPDQGGMPAAQRQEREAEVTARVLRLEREEEALIEQAQAQGIECHRRPNASGWAILGIEIGREQEQVAA